MLGLGHHVRTLYPPLRFPVLPQFIISLLEFHCLPANTTRPNKNVYCFSSTVTTFLLFPSSTIITFLLFSSGATRFLLFSFYHHYHHNSTVFPLPPPQFCCFPRPHHLQIYCFPAPSTTPFPPQSYYFSSSTPTTTFPFLFSFFTTTTIWVESIFLKDLALEQFSPRKSQPSAFKLLSRKGEIFALLFVPPDRKSIRASPRRKLKSHSFRAFKMHSQLHKCQPETVLLIA